MRILRPGTVRKEVPNVLEILRKFFHFCDGRERREFYVSIVLSVAAALFSALKIPAIGVMLGAILAGGVTVKTILLSLAIMLVSVIGSSLLKYRATALQTDGGYSTTADKRIQIVEHLRYLPMGYFNENSLGAITSVTTNTMRKISASPMAISPSSMVSPWTFRKSQQQPLSAHPAAARLRSATYSPASGTWTAGRSRWAGMMCGSTTWTV